PARDRRRLEGVRGTSRRAPRAVLGDVADARGLPTREARRCEAIHGACRGAAGAALRHVAGPVHWPANRPGVTRRVGAVDGVSVTLVDGAWVAVARARGARADLPVRGTARAAARLR